MAANLVLCNTDVLFCYTWRLQLYFFTVVEPGTRGWEKIKEVFGPDVFLYDGSLDRETLGKIIFEDSTKRMALNKITHPERYKAILWQLSGYLFKGLIIQIFTTKKGCDMHFLGNDTICPTL